MGVYVTLMTQGLEDFTLPLVGAISICVLLLVAVIHEGSAASLESTTDVKEPVVAQEPEVHALIAGEEVYALADTEGSGNVTVVVESTGAVLVMPVPASQGCKSQLQAGVFTVTVKVVVTAVWVPL